MTFPPATPPATPSSPASASKPIAWRGATALEEADLRAHLAALIRVDRIGVLLGAGASVVAGGHVINRIWKELTDNGTVAKLTTQKFEASAARAEQIMDDLAVASRDAARRGDATAAKGYEDLLSEVRRAFGKASLLSSPWWNRTEDPRTADALTHHRQLLVKLTGARQPGQMGPWVFTPNYDLAVEWAAEAAGLHIANGFHGLHQRTFSAHTFDLAHRNVHARGEARFGTYDVYLSKLHGSLTWRQTGDEVVEEPASQAWEKLEPFISGTTSTWPGFIVYPGSAKFDQTSGHLLGEMFRKLADFVSCPQSALVVSGYSFGDHHINRMLHAGLQNPTFQLVAYVREFESKDGKPDRTKLNPWLRDRGALEHPQLTIVGSGDRANFDKMVADLPDPAIYDDRAQRLRAQLRDIASKEPSDP